MPHNPNHTPVRSQRTARIRRSSESPSTSASPRSSRLSQSPAMSSTRKKKFPKKATPSLEHPLSVVTQDYKIPLKDIAAWVSRPTAERLAEVARNNGRIARPMNSFMLYRSAYAARVKVYCKEDNHQVVSKVTGASWQIEPREIRELYEQFADIERENHTAAHPDYKFSPNKNGKKRIQEADDDDDSTDSDDDVEYDGSSRSAKRSRTAGRDSSRSHSSTPFEDMHNGQYGSMYYPLPHHAPVLHPSSYRASNPYGPEPRMYWHNNVPVRPSPFYQPGMEMHFDELSLNTYDPGHNLVGLPHSSSQDLLGIQTGAVMQPSTFAYPSPTTQSGFRIDPQLDPHYNYTGYEDGRNSQFNLVPRQYPQTYAPPTANTISTPYPIIQHGQGPSQAPHPSHQQYHEDTQHGMNAPVPQEGPVHPHPGMMTLTESPTSARSWVDGTLKTPDFNGEFPWP